MNFNARLITIQEWRKANTVLAEINCDPTGVKLMANKALFRAVKLEGVPTKAANLLKQTFLAKGGEVAVARGSADLSIDYTDVLILATIKQFNLALAQLKSQPWGLPKAAQAIEAALQAADGFTARTYHWKNRLLSLTPGRTLVMGILNLTPDSFSDGGKYLDMDAALRHAQSMVENGADIIDVGAESTRPYGSRPITAEEECGRLLPVLEKVLKNIDAPVSVDTYKAEVAREALKAGAHFINDIWGLQREPDMAAAVAEYGVPIIIMHNQKDTHYDNDIMSEICKFLRKSADIALNAGVQPDNILIDPGIGFGKTPAQNLVVMSRLEELRSLGYPILLGTSRKRFIGEVLGGAPANDRLEGTGATVAIGIAKGVSIVRVHDVKEMVRVARMTDAMLRGSME
ncbi:MAG: dihydropteroate synthase [Negativicutes bacterium]|nr:dihydropteroate synthase [Negativicutes bacterium]